MATAVAAVLSTPELLEAIILELSTRQICVIQRVDTTFRDVIRGSPSLQRALFLRPTTDYVLQPHNTRYHVEPCSSRADCAPEIGPDPQRDKSGLTARWAVHEEDQKQHIVVLNPLFMPKRIIQRELKLPARKRVTSDSTRSRMLLTQPPVGALVVDHCEAHHFHLVHASNPKWGLTIGDFETNVRNFAGRVIVPKIEKWQEVPVLRNSTASEILGLLSSVAMKVDRASSDANSVGNEVCETVEEV